MGKSAIELEEEDAMRRYERAFGESFPRMMCGITGGQEFIDLLDECVRKGEPFDPYDGGRIPYDAIF